METETQETETTATTEQQTETLDTKTYSAEEFKRLASEKKAKESEVNDLKAKLKQIEDDKLKASGDLQAQLTAREKELEQLSNEKQSLETAKTELEALQTEIKKDLLEQLSKEHLKIAEKLSIQDLKEYVALNSKHTKGMDAGRTGKGSIDLTGKTYDDFTTDKLKELRESNPEGYKKLYKDKYGRFPVLKN